MDKKIEDVLERATLRVEELEQKLQEIELKKVEEVEKLQEINENEEEDEEQDSDEDGKESSVDEENFLRQNKRVKLSKLESGVSGMLVNEA